MSDEILFLASQRYEEEAQHQAETASQQQVVAEEKENGPLVQASEVSSSGWGILWVWMILDVREAGVAKKTRAQTEWCRRIWAKWVKSRRTHLKGEEKYVAWIEGWYLWDDSCCNELLVMPVYFGDM